MKNFFFLPVVLCFLDIACLAQGDFSLAPVMDVTGEELAARFRSPDGEAGMSCYWWWLNTAVTKESITHDLEEMKSKGYGSASIIDAGGFNEVTMKPEHGPLFLSPEWIELFQHAVREADRLGISLTVNVSSGWNPGGPYVTPHYDSPTGRRDLYLLAVTEFGPPHGLPATAHSLPAAPFQPGGRALPPRSISSYVGTGRAVTAGRQSRRFPASQ